MNVFQIALRVLVLVAVMLPCALARVGAQPGAAQDTPSVSEEAASEESPVRMQPDIARQVATQAERFRDSQSLPAMRSSEPLQKAAEDFARFMARTARYGHNADEREPWDRAAEAKYEACVVAENIGQQWSARPLAADELARRFVEGWKNSARHRANLLDPDLTETAVGVAQSEQSGKYYAVQLFGRPQSEAIRVEIANRTDSAVKYQLGDEDFELPSQTIRTHLLCRPGTFRFALPTAEDADRTVSEQVKAKARLIVERGDGGEVTVTRPANK